MCNYRHPGPQRVWEMGPEPRSLPPLPALLRPLKLLLHAPLERSRGPRALLCDAQARQFVRVAALPRRREHRKLNFHQKNTNDLEDHFFVVLPSGAKRLIFTMNYHLRNEQVFTILTPSWPNSTSGPREASGLQLGHVLTQYGSNLTPIQ